MKKFWFGHANKDVIDRHVQGPSEAVALFGERVQIEKVGLGFDAPRCARMDAYIKPR